MAVGFSAWKTLRPMERPAAPALSASKVVCRTSWGDLHLGPPAMTTGDWAALGNLFEAIYGACVVGFDDVCA